MSLITNVILSMGSNTDEEAKEYMQQVNAFFEGKTVYSKAVEFAHVNDWQAKESVYNLESDLAIGAFNYLDLEALIEHLRAIDWQQPASVQLLVRGQNDVGFRVIDVFPETC